MGGYGIGNLLTGEIHEGDDAMKPKLAAADDFNKRTSVLSAVVSHWSKLHTSDNKNYTYVGKRPKLSDEPVLMNVQNARSLRSSWGSSQ